MKIFSELEDTADKVEWCSSNIGLMGQGWEWELDWINYEERTGVIIRIEDDAMAMAFKLRWV